MKKPVNFERSWLAIPTIDYLPSAFHAKLLVKLFRTEIRKTSLSFIVSSCLKYVLTGY